MIKTLTTALLVLGTAAALPVAISHAQDADQPEDKEPKRLLKLFGEGKAEKPARPETPDAPKARDVEGDNASPFKVTQTFTTWENGNLKTFEKSADGRIRVTIKPANGEKSVFEYDSEDAFKAAKPELFKSWENHSKAFNFRRVELPKHPLYRGLERKSPYRQLERAEKPTQAPGNDALKKAKDELSKLEGLFKGDFAELDLKKIQGEIRKLREHTKNLRKELEDVESELETLKTKRGGLFRNLELPDFKELEKLELPGGDPLKGFEDLRGFEKLFDDDLKKFFENDSFDDTFKKLQEESRKRMDELRKRLEDNQGGEMPEFEDLFRKFFEGMPGHKENEKRAPKDAEEDF